MLYQLKKLGSKVLDHVLSNLTAYLFSAMISILASILAVFRTWLLAGCSVTFPRGLWLLLGLGVIVCLVLLLRSFAKLRGRLTNPTDIKNAIDVWLSNGDRHIELPVERDRQYYFSDVDRTLSVKRGSARKYLPFLARCHNYGIQSGKKTFALVKLSKITDLVSEFLKHLKPDVLSAKKEVEIDCDPIARRFGWTPEGVVQFVLELKTQWCLSESEGLETIKVRVLKGNKVIISQPSQADQGN